MNTCHFAWPSALILILQLAKQGCERGLRMLQLALPDGQYPPPVAEKLLLNPPVPLYIIPEFLSPEIGASLGQRGESASFVVVPEAAMDENTGPETWQHNIRTPGEILAMQPKTISTGMQKLSHRYFRLGIPAPDAGHHSGSRRTVDDIHSYPLSTA